MKKTDARIIRVNNTTHTNTQTIEKTDARNIRVNDDTLTNAQTIEKTETVIVIPTDPAVIPYPCDDQPEPEPDVPEPNPDRPPINPVRPEPNPDRPIAPVNLIYTNGVQKVNNTVGLKINDDSVRYVTATENGLSVNYLVEKLNRVRKNLHVLRHTTTVLKSDVNQLQDELKLPALRDKLVVLMPEFIVDGSGNLILNIGDGLGIDDEGSISTFWSEFNSDNG